MSSLVLPVNPTVQQLREISAFYQKHNVTESDGDKSGSERIKTFPLAQRSKRDVLVRWRKDIPETLIDDVMKPSFAAFNLWKTSLEKTPELVVEDLFIRSVDMVAPPKPFFADMTATIRLEGSEHTFDGDAFLRGRSVSVLIVLTLNGEDYTVITVQPRAPAAIPSFPEIPAGAVLDPTASRGVLNMLKTRIGLFIEQEELIDLTARAFGNEYPGIIPSGATCDEYITLYLCQLQVDPESHDLDDLRDRVSKAEGQSHITLRVIPLADLWQVAPDGKSLSALAIYHHLKSNGSLLKQDQRTLGEAMKDPKLLSAEDATKKTPVVGVDGAGVASSSSGAASSSSASSSSAPRAQKEGSARTLQVDASRHVGENK